MWRAEGELRKGCARADWQHQRQSIKSVAPVIIIVWINFEMNHASIWRGHDDRPSHPPTRDIHIPINYYYSWTFSFWIRLETNSISCDGWDPSIFSARTSSSDLDFFHCCSAVCLFVNRAEALSMVADVPAPLADAAALLWRLLNALIPLKPLMLALLLLLALLLAVASIVSHVSIIDALLFELMAAAKKLFATHA